MSIRNLEYLFNPRSVALIGASARPASVGAVLAKNLLDSHFAGPVWLVNGRAAEIHGQRSYAGVASLPEAPDLAIIATPPDTIPALISELGERGTRAAIVISAGFGESRDGNGKALLQAMHDAAQPHLLRIIGPNCLGMMVPGVGLNAGFAHIAPRPGKLAFLAQSGAIVTSVLDWADSRGIGFSHMVSLGGMSDVDFGDLLDYLADDPGTEAILLYIESITAARKFMSAARAASRSKPVIVVKAGRHEAGAKAIASHTGALAGADAVYDAAFQRAGMLRVYNLEALFDAVQALASPCKPRGERLAILTNGGGVGILATDALMDEGGQLAELSPQTLAKLDAVLPPTWSHANPVDIVGDATGERYAAALAVLREAKEVDAVLVMNCPVAVASGIEAAEAVIGGVSQAAQPAILTCWVGESAAEPARKLFARHGIPSYDTPMQAVRAFMYLVHYRRNQALLTETPPSIAADFSPDVEAARAIVDSVLSEGRDWLSEPEAKALLAAYGVPVVATRIAASAAEAAAIAAELGGPVALKILSPDITHKTDVGGVVLDLHGPAAVRDAAAAMLARVEQAQPEARIEGVTVQPMVDRPGAHELIVGMVEDAQFGPVMVIGQGGTAVEIVDDKALGLPPLNLHLAREMLSRTRVHKLLQGYRGLPAADLDGIALSLVRVAQLVIDLPQLTELDINPLLADSYGVVALDARVRVEARSGHGAERLAIRPYPRELEEQVTMPGGRELLLRPIRPEDEPALQAAFTQLTPEEIRLRFFMPLKTLNHVTAARFTQIDYDREMALVLTEDGAPGKAPIYGVVRISADPDNRRAEYAIVVLQKLSGNGLGTLLMQRIIDHARQRGIGEIFGDVLRDNQHMLDLCKRLGFVSSPIEGDFNVLRVTLKLAD